MESLKNVGSTSVSKRQENALVESSTLNISEKPLSPTCDQLSQLKSVEQNDESNTSGRTDVDNRNERLSCPIPRPVSRGEEMNENMANKVPSSSMIPSPDRDGCLDSTPSVSLSLGTPFNDGEHKVAFSKLLASPSQYYNSSGNGVDDIQVITVSPGTALDDQKREAALQVLLATQSDELLDANTPDSPAVYPVTIDDFGFDGFNFGDNGDRNFGFGCEMNNEAGGKDDGFSLFGGNDGNASDGGMSFSIGEGDKLEMGLNANTSADFSFFDAAATNNESRGDGVENMSFCLSFGGDKMVLR